MQIWEYSDYKEYTIEAVMVSTQTKMFLGSLAYYWYEAGLRTVHS